MYLPHCSRLRQAGSDGQRESLWRAAACPSSQYGQNVGDPPGWLHRSVTEAKTILQGSASTTATTICKFPRRRKVRSNFYIFISICCGWMFQTYVRFESRRSTAVRIDKLDQTVYYSCISNQPAGTAVLKGQEWRTSCIISVFKSVWGFGTPTLCNCGD